jgi:hypothetical protein
MKRNPLAVASACLQAYVNKDRAEMESLIADDYRFTSPIDNALDRNAYFATCWPNSNVIVAFDYVYQSENKDHAFIVYEGRTSTGSTFRNCEVHTVRDGQLVSTEVYFGWEVPHKVPKGTHVDKDGQGDI